MFRTRFHAKICSSCEISLNCLGARKFYFLLLFSLSICAVWELLKLLVFFLSTVESWNYRQKRWSRKYSSVGGWKSMVTHPFPTFNTPKKPVPDVETGRRGRRTGCFAHQILQCWWKKIPLEILLSQNFNGLAKRLHRPSGGSIISQQIGCWKGFIVGDACCFDYTHISCLELSVVEKKQFSLSCAIRFMLAID